VQCPHSLLALPLPPSIIQVNYLGSDTLHNNAFWRFSHGPSTLPVSQAAPYVYLLDYSLSIN